jgi:hypothetical protein
MFEGTASEAAGLRARLVGTKREVVCWDTGPSRDQATGRILDQLSEEGFAVLHALVWPQRGIDVDHLVIGPTGIWVVASKDFSYPLSLCRRGRLWSGCHPVTEALEEARAAARCVAETLAPALDGADVDPDVAVMPVLAVHTAVVPDRHLHHGDVHIVDASRSLLHLVRQSRLVLEPTLVAQVAERARAVSGASA